MSTNDVRQGMRAWWLRSWWSAVVGVLCGVASALFLSSLDAVTEARTSFVLIAYALPFAGALLGWALQRWAQPVLPGNNLLIDRVNEGGDTVPLRMAPIVLLGTLVTHLFGGSAGREGTAVQMGGSLADNVAVRARVDADTRRQLLIAGMAGGFGSVFGTPLAGALFGIEVAMFGRWQWRAAVPALIAALVGDGVTRALGIAHTDYPRVASIAWSWLLFARWLALSVAVALCVVAFIELTHWIKRVSAQRLPNMAWRMAVGGACVVVLWQVIGSDDYLGLGVPTIVRAFDDPALPNHAFALKLLLTAITIGVGFVGGEVTPLFFIGATLGNALAKTLDLPLDLTAAVTMVAMFGAASNTPFALAVMAFELFGANAFPHALCVCLASCLLTGQRSIYAAQRYKRDSKPMPSKGPE